MAERERRCGRLEGGQFAPGRSAQRGVGEFAAGASDQISLIKWENLRKRTGRKRRASCPMLSKIVIHDNFPLDDQPSL